MEHIKCKECGAEVGLEAKACPKCGAQTDIKSKGGDKIIGLLFIIGVIIISLIYLYSPSKNSGPSSSTVKTSSDYKTVTENTPTPESTPGDQWTYSQVDDDMARGKVYKATVISTNTVNFDFPYSGEQHSTLMLRTHPRYGKDIIFRIEKGQILCNSGIENCKILVRFDDQESVNFSASSPEDNSTETIFILNYSRFIEKMLKAKRVRISVNIYQEGSPVFEFDVRGFDPSKYKPKI